MAHPDDVEFLIAGTLFHLKAADWDVGIVTMTAGDKGSTTHSQEEVARIRHAEAQAGAEYLGAWYHCVGLMDLEIFATAENISRVVEQMRIFQPDVVITHSPVDYLLDHEETARIVRSAAFAMSAPLYKTGHTSPAQIGHRIPTLYYADPIAGNNPLGERIYPHFYVVITDQLGKKRDMLSCHASQRKWMQQQHGVDEYLEQMTDWASQYGQECGAGYAEGLRQHWGHAFPEEPILQEVLKPHVHRNEGIQPPSIRLRQEEPNGQE